MSAAALPRDVARAARAAWAYLRAVTGDSAYETYRDRARRQSLPPLTREQFYLDRLGRRYAGVSRCC